MNSAASFIIVSALTGVCEQRNQQRPSLINFQAIEIDAMCGHGFRLRYSPSGSSLVVSADLSTLPSRKRSSQRTQRWREMDSNFRFRASGDTPHPPRGEAASHRSRLPLRRDPPSGGDLDDGTVSQLLEELAGRDEPTLGQEKAHIGVW